MRAAFFLVGTTMGAGFLTGAELVRFFGGQGYLCAFALSCALYGGACAFFLRLGKKYGGFAGAMQALFRGAAKAVTCLLLAVSFVPCAGMLAGLDALFAQVRPLGSLLGLVVVLVFLSRGFKGIGLLNVLLVPLLLVFVLSSGTGAGASPVPELSEAGNALCMPQ